MSKKKLFYIIAISALAGWMFSIFPGKYFEAKISTWPILNKWKILSPQAPIVITNQQTIRVSDSGDAVKAINDVKSKLSLVVSGSGNLQTVVGAAVNLTSDGAFVTSASVLSEKNGSDFSVLLNDGTSAKIIKKTIDPGTELVFFLADTKNVPVVNLGSSKEMSVGEKIIFAQSSLTPFSVRSKIYYVTSTQTDFVGQVFSSDSQFRCFSVVVPDGILAGDAVVNTSGELVGIYDGTQVICSDYIKQAEGLYFKNNQNILRPAFGFSYQALSKSQRVDLGEQGGVLVKAVKPGSSAQKAGLIVGDVIVAVGSKSIGALALDEILQTYSPQDELNMGIIRAGKNINLKLIVGVLK